MRYVFLNQDSIVVNTIVGDLTPEQLSRFLDDYAKLFGATQVIPVGDEQAVWIGGSYTDGTFQAPPEPEPAPEPAPEIIEGVVEVLPEPQPEPEI
jgi:hypothetical protein